MQTKRLIAAALLIISLAVSAYAGPSGPVTFKKTGQTSLAFNLSPFKYANDIGYGTSVANVQTQGGTVYQYNQGLKYLDITLVWDKDRPLNRIEYDGFFNYSTMTETSGKQSLVNWYWNVAPATTFTIMDANGINRTAFILDNNLKFQPLDQTHVIGTLNLRVEY